MLSDHAMAGVEGPKAPKPVPEKEYRNYAEYIKDNAGKPPVGSKLAQAARMAAANALSRAEPDAPFDKNTLQKKAHEFYKNKSFKIMAADPENVDRLLKGDFAGFAKEVDDMKTSCSAMIDDNGELEISGYPTLSLDRLEKRAKKNPDLIPVVESVYKILPAEDGEDKITEKDIMDAVGTIVDYQNRHVTDIAGIKRRDLTDTMRLLHELTKGRSINGIVDHQMKMINGFNDLAPDHLAYMSRERIETEGLEAEQQARIDLGIDAPAADAEAVEANGIDEAGAEAGKANRNGEAADPGNQAPVM